MIHCIFITDYSVHLPLSYHIFLFSFFFLFLFICHGHYTVYIFFCPQPFRQFSWVLLGSLDLCFFFLTKMVFHVLKNITDSRSFVYSFTTHLLSIKNWSNLNKTELKSVTLTIPTDKPIRLFFNFISIAIQF